MDPQQQFCLKWNSFGSNLVSAFDNLFKSESLTDVTLFCEGVTFKAHRIILAACSKHFQELFEAAPHCPSVLVILDGTSSANMSALLEFMYKGEVHVKHESLSSFLKAAECLQVKGLSIEHEKMAEAQSDVKFEPRLDSPSRASKQSKTNTTESSKEQSEESPTNSMHPPSTSSYTPVMSPYMHHYMHHYDSRTGAPTPSSPYDSLPRKRPHRSPSDSSIRASVLRDGSKPEHLRVKLVSPVTERIKSEWGGYSNNEGAAGAAAEPSTPERMPAIMWPLNVNSGTSTKMATAHKTSATTTPDGKKLQCPFCERLYGYETNLRAHIRQRHQGIRVPCPFCSRTFTRNNTVRRHIAREHKTELSPFQQTELSPLQQTELASFQQTTQVQNHNQ
ncbi:zinc finger protein chinmo isoform X2 [Macrosteles quadrilineatus]|uniref:zinc finger protein chinmo isoform X2 n=1 Tax=Macrosteles quadrilineatus TaxID=74068 RepID=UPI0023E1E718|nr:zinc finger protein chinmo isoform X2 [Macrosteles quadrilineatus]